jgi:methylmalonyl-CoA mutase C-terminal domain/subunit
MHHYCASRLAGLARVPGMSESLGADAVTDDETASATGAGAASTDVIRVVVAKPGLDGHDRGAKVVARALRDAGMEVIYTGLHQTPEQIVEAAIQEDADVVGLSVLSGAHLTLFARVVELLAERDASDIVVFGGGIIPDDDIAELERLGVAKVFTPGATTMEIVEWVRQHVHPA